MKKIVYTLDPASINAAIKSLEEYEKWVEERSMVLCERLASLGATRASLDFSRATYDGKNDVSVKVEAISNGYKVIASGGAVLFIEFGSGAKYGSGHPEPMGYGPGTYPGKGHWDDPNGWYLPSDVAEYKGQKSYGNPPAAGMYNGRKMAIEEFYRIAKEVFV